MRMLLHDRIRDSYIHPQFIADVIKPLQIEPLYDQEVSRGFQNAGQMFLLLLCLTTVVTDVREVPTNA